MNSATVAFEELLRQWRVDRFNRCEVRRSHLGMLLQSGETVEHLLEHLVRTRDLLLHGSTIEIREWELKPGSDGVRLPPSYRKGQCPWLDRARTRVLRRHGWHR